MTSLKAHDITLLRRFLLAAMLLALAAFVAITARWHMMWDTQVMHYVDFLTAHGFAPYRTIGDMNMPGAYWSEHLGIVLFGHTDLSWRLYEFFLLALLTWGMLLISRPYDRLAGLTAGALFVLIHGLDLANNAVQRDEVMTVALVLAVAALFAAVRRNSAVFACVAGLLFGYATAIKPTALLLAVALLCGMVLVQIRRRMSFALLLTSSLGGIFFVGLGVLEYLHHYQAIGPFLFILRKVIPAYAPMDSVGTGRLLALALNPIAWIVLVLAVCASLSLKKGRETAFGEGSIEHWEQFALLTAFIFGVGSYLLQHKGYPYHRYPATAFGLLWALVVLLRALRSTRRAPAGLALVAIIFLCLLAVPVSLAGIAGGPSRDAFSDQLADDLRTLGPDRLQHQIQCLDVVFGCMNALYHDGIVQNYGATGDLLYFQPQATAIVQYYRNDFWTHLQSSSPDVFLLSNQWFGERHTFDKVNAWPQFAGYLRANYVPVVERSFNENGRVTPAAGADTSRFRAYRIYIRKGSPLLQAAQQLRP